MEQKISRRYAFLARSSSSIVFKIYDGDFEAVECGGEKRFSRLRALFECVL